MFTCSRQEKADSRYFLTFFVHAEETRLKMVPGRAGSSMEIALWLDAERALIASNNISFPCYIEN